LVRLTRIITVSMIAFVHVQLSCKVLQCVLLIARLRQRGNYVLNLTDSQIDSFRMFTRLEYSIQSNQGFCEQIENVVQEAFLQIQFS